MEKNDIWLPSTIGDNGIETNLEQIAAQICSKCPQEPCSIQLILDHDTDTDIEFEILSTYTLSCMKILFGEDATPYDLDEGDFKLLNSYVQSVGYNLIVDKEETATSYRFNITFEPYHSLKNNTYSHLSKYML